VAGRPLRPATDRRLGEPLPHQLANPTWAHPSARGLTIPRFHPKISCGISPAFAGLFPTKGQIPMYYAPVRRSSARIATPVTARLACVKHAASVQSEPGSNSSVQWFELKRDPKLQTCPVLPGRLDAWLLAVAPMNGHLTRVPTQITCNFLKSARAAKVLGRAAYYARRPGPRTAHNTPHEPARPVLSRTARGRGARSIAPRLGESTAFGPRQERRIETRTKARFPACRR
jgi:hypothetical protein